MSYVASHYFYLSISLPRSIADLITVVYFSSAGIVQKGKSRNWRARFSMMAMHIDAICAFTCMRQYVVSISVF